MGKGAVGVAGVAAVPVGYSDAVTEFKLILLVVKKASKSRDEVLKQGIVTLENELFEKTEN